MDYTPRFSLAVRVVAPIYAVWSFVFAWWAWLAAEFQCDPSCTPDRWVEFSDSWQWLPLKISLLVGALILLVGAVLTMTGASRRAVISLLALGVVLQGVGTAFVNDGIGGWPFGWYAQAGAVAFLLLVALWKAPSVDDPPEA